MQGTQYATKSSILCRGAFCGPTKHVLLKTTLFLDCVDWPYCVIHCGSHCSCDTGILFMHVFTTVI